MTNSVSPNPTTTVHDRRWAILAVICVSVLVTVLDGTIVNIALPTFTAQLGASTRELQWIVDAYLLVFANPTGVMAILNPIVLGAIAIVTLALCTGVVARFIELVEDGQFLVRR